MWAWRWRRTWTGSQYAAKHHQFKSYSWSSSQKYGTGSPRTEFKSKRNRSGYHLEISNALPFPPCNSVSPLPPPLLLLLLPSLLSPYLPSIFPFQSFSINITYKLPNTILLSEDTTEDIEGLCALGAQGLEQVIGGAYGDLVNNPRPPHCNGCGGLAVRDLAMLLGASRTRVIWIHPLNLWKARASGKVL